MKAPVTLLAIETSCDETAVAVVRREGEEATVLAEAVASQTDLHAATGGIVPEAAAREHVAALPVLLRQALTDSRLTGPALSGIAVTIGPGLQPALAVGVTAAQTLSYSWQKPLIPVNHLEGHLYSALLQPTSATDLRHWTAAEVTFPVLALIVSGGHTLLVTATSHGYYEKLGTTLDDAAGEAFDKVARLLGLSYPGGPALARAAQSGDPTAFAFPRPLQRTATFDFSFSGLKTAVLYTWRALSPAEQARRLPDVAASFQAAVVDALVTKVERAIAHVHPTTLLVAGGVAANEALRQAIQRVTDRAGIALRLAPLPLCGDNAVMIGLAALWAGADRRVLWSEIEPVARPPLMLVRPPTSAP